MASARIEGLTERQTDVLLLAARGLSNNEIALRLVVSQATVRNHLTAIYSATGAQSKTGLLILALRRGWLALEDL